MKATMTPLVVAGVAAIALLASPTVADLMFQDPITVNGTAGPEDGGTIWGTHGTLGNQDNGLPHLFGGVSVYEDDVFAGLGLVVIVNSVELTPPPGKRFAGAIVFDFTSFDPEFLTNHSIDIGPIKSPGENPINTVDLIGPGSVFTDGSSIFWDGLGADLGLNPIVTIGWTQIPAPGTAALLGVAALVLTRRRRR